MASLKVFVSSTCYDLNIVRSELRGFLVNLGHEPVMSDFNDVLFDPRIHTHESCVKEIGGTDAVILIIGSRFGGLAIPKAVASLDIDNLKLLSKGNKLLETPDKVSVTQLEILKAIESNIPIFTFIDSRVLHDHLFYEKNKDKGILDSIDFPSIDKKDTAIFIFEFINYLRLRSKNNSITEFNKLSDIEDFLKKQWSSLLQRLLYEQRLHKSESRRIEQVSEELKDIKSLILSSISTDQAKEVGRGVIRFRRAIEFFLYMIHEDIENLLLENISWEELFEKLKIHEVAVLENGNKFRPVIYLLKTDGTYYACRSIAVNSLKSIAAEWSNFRSIKNSVKKEIINALKENLPPPGIFAPVKYRSLSFTELINNLTDVAKEEGKEVGTLINFNINTFAKPDDISEEEV